MARKGSDVDDSWFIMSHWVLSRWDKTHTHLASKGHFTTLTHTRTHSEYHITQRDMASHSPKDNDDTSVHSNPSTQGTHINTLYTQTEITENTLWHTPAQLSVKMTSESQLGEMSSPQHDNQQRLRHCYIKLQINLTPVFIKMSLHAALRFEPNPQFNMEINRNTIVQLTSWHTVLFNRLVSPFAQSCVMQL